MEIDQIVRVRPQQKDKDRVEDFAFFKRGYRNWFYGNGAPISSNASKQAKLIKDPLKLIRRAKAVVNRWGTRDYYGYSGGNPILENAWKPFEEALRNMGFNREQIQAIIDNPKCD